MTAAPVAAGAAGVRHDLRHGLAGLQALLRSVPPGSAGLSSVLDAASAEVRYVMDLVDVLPSPDTDAGAVLAPGPVGAVCDLADVVRAAARAAAWSDRTLTVDCPASLRVALAAPAASRMVRNLLGNALAAPAGTAVLLRGQLLPGSGTGDSVLLEVHDDGRGTAAKDFSRPGGVGLEVVRSLVLGAGGWLCLGPSPRGGVRAAVTLPAPSGSRR